jgi:type IV secretory pathway component VirB8
MMCRAQRSISLWSVFFLFSTLAAFFLIATLLPSRQHEKNKENG